MSYVCYVGSSKGRGRGGSTDLSRKVLVQSQKGGRTVRQEVQTLLSLLPVCLQSPGGGRVNVHFGLGVSSRLLAPPAPRPCQVQRWEARAALVPLHGRHLLLPGRQHLVEGVPADGRSVEVKRRGA